MAPILERLAARVRRLERVAAAHELGYGRTKPVTPKTLALAAVLASLAPAARAGESACWFEGGVVVIPASVMGVAGDYILDTGQAATQLAETQAQGAGFEAVALTGDVRLAGERLAAHRVAVADLDVRTGLLPTPIAGVIGADVLKGYVVDVSFAPCRVRLSRAGRAPRFGPAAALPMAWRDGRPEVAAAVSDGAGALSVRLTPSTGADAPIRLSDALAAAEGASRPQEVYPYGVLRPRLRALSLAGVLFEDQPAGLLKAGAGDGWLGAPVLSHFRVRFDFPAGVLRLAPAS